MQNVVIWKVSWEFAAALYLQLRLPRQTLYICTFTYSNREGGGRVVVNQREGERGNRREYSRKYQYDWSMQEIGYVYKLCVCWTGENPADQILE